MLNPITALTTTIASTITSRADTAPYRQVTGRQSQQPTGPEASELALLAVRDEHGRPLAGVYVPDHLLLF